MRTSFTGRPITLYAVLAVLMMLLVAACGGSETTDEAAPVVVEESEVDSSQVTEDPPTEAQEEQTDEVAEPTQAANDEPTPLSISATGVDALPFMAILQVAIDKGWFDEAGVDASLFSGGGGGDTLRVVSTGDADLAIAGNTAVYLAAQQPDSNLQIIGSWFPVNDFFWITSDPNATLEGSSLSFSRAGSTTELIVKAIQEARPDDGIEAVQVGGMGDSWAAARSGQVTAGWAMHPFVTDKVQNEDATVLVAARDVIGDHPADLVAVNTTYAEENPETLTAFFEVAQRAMDYVVDDTEAAAADLAGVLGLEADIVQAGLEDTPELEFAYSLTVDEETLTNLSDLMIATGQISDPVNWAEVLDQQYLPEEAKADLGG